MTVKEFFKNYNSVAVAFSGGVDSSVLLCLAAKYAKRVKAYYVKSQFQPQFELDDALEISKLLEVEIEIINCDVLCEKTVVSNPENRCYYCKKAIFGNILKKAKKDGFETVLDGTNATDDISDRPGFKALVEYGVLSPLRLCGLTKSEIRKIAEENGLPVADKPSYACLATRVPYGTEITAEILEKTENAENMLRKCGLKNFRVRYKDGAALLQFCKKDFEIYNNNREKIDSFLLEYYNGVSIDSKVRDDE